MHLFFDAPPEAPTTRGFAGILQTGLDGLSADEVLATPAEFTSQLGLTEAGQPAAAARAWPPCWPGSSARSATGGPPQPDRGRTG